MKYFLVTVLRNGKHESLVFSSDTCASVERFLIFDTALGIDTHILYSKEISFDDYMDLKKVLMNK